MDKTVHFIEKEARQERGLFYEEIPHAIDYFTDPELISKNKFNGSNERLHAGTAERAAVNPMFRTSPEEQQALLDLSGRLKAWK